MSEGRDAPFQEFRSPPRGPSQPPQSPDAPLVSRLARGVKQGLEQEADMRALRPYAEQIAEVFNDLRGRGDGSLVFSDGACFVDRSEVRVATYDREVVTELERQGRFRGIGGFEVCAEVDPVEAVALLSAWRGPIPQGEFEDRYARSQFALREVRERLMLGGEAPFQYLPIDVIGAQLSRHSENFESQERRALLTFARLLARTRQALDKLAERADARPEIRALERAVQTLIEGLDNDVFRGAILIWSYIRGLERIIIHHNVSTAIMVACVGRELSLDPVRLSGLVMAAVMHDFIASPHNPQGIILWAESSRCAMTTGRFSRDLLYRMILPYEHLQLHLLNLPQLDQQAPIFESHLLGIACAFDRASRDSYIPPYQALRQVSQNRSFHRAAISALVSALGVYPRGTLLRLSDGTLAVVVENGRHRLHRPYVRLVQKADGSVYPGRVSIDLLDPNAPGIEGALDERNLGLEVMGPLIESANRELGERLAEPV